MPAHNRTFSFFSRLMGPTSLPNPQGPPPPPRDQQQISRTPAIPSPLTRGQSDSPVVHHPQPQSPPVSQLHPEIRSVVGLTTAHAHKIYFSGPLVRKIERQPDGQRPVKDDGWVDVWAQLGGTTLSIWDMKLIQEASRQGKEVPPTYVNITDAFVQVLGSVTVPATQTTPSQRFTNVLTLNTAGSNLLLFSCPTSSALVSWAAALRLSGWEKSRLEEIYTAHLIRITLGVRGVPTTLVQGHLEGWVRIRIAGQTDWKRAWMVVNAGHLDHSTSASHAITSPPPPAQQPRRKRMSNLFSRDPTPQQPTRPAKANISMHVSGKPKDKKKPILTLKDVTQAFAVYPERPELISRSTLIKIEGTFGEEDTAHMMRAREGWLLVMPELEEGLDQANEMLKWIVALHDAFGLYGRPEAWAWDPRDPVSLMFAYPVGPNKDLLFLDREVAETLDPRDDRTSAIRSRLQGLLFDRMPGHDNPPPPPPREPSLAQPPALPPINTQSMSSNTEPTSPHTDGPQLPPLNFADTGAPDKKPLTPITERSSAYTNGRSLSLDAPPGPAPPSSAKPEPSHSRQGSLAAGLPDQTVVLDRPFTQSPTPNVGSPKLPLQATQHTPANQMTLGSSPQTTTESARPIEPSVQSALALGPSVVSVSERAKPMERTDSSNTRQSQSIGAPPSDDTTSSGAPVHFRSPSPLSILTSPHSAVEHESHATSLTSPYSPQHTTRRLGTPSVRGHALESPKSPTSSVLPSSPPRVVQRTDDSGNLLNEAGALYYMQKIHPSSSSGHQSQARRRLPPTADDVASSSENSSDASPVREAAEDDAGFSQSRSFPVRQSTPMAFLETKAPSAATVPGDRQATSSTTRSGLGRKPSGARAQGTPSYNAQGFSSGALTEEQEGDDSEDSHTPPVPMEAQNYASSGPPDETDLDALAALSYLAVDDQNQQAPPTSQPKVEPLNIRPAKPSSPMAAPASQLAESATQYKSSFAPSKQAAERKAKAQAQQAAHHAAVHKPGRAAGKRKSKIAGAWNESSEDEDEEDEEDEDVDSDVEPPVPGKALKPDANTASSRSHSQERGVEAPVPQPYSHLRPPRTLPQIPSPGGYNDEMNPPPRRMASDQYSDSGRRPYHDSTQIRTQAEVPHPGPPRQTVWSQVLEPGRQPGALPEPSNSTRGTFVQLEPAETMTKAFTPQGLLSAGIQDKQDRSAKRQEELARETGASLINVPNKPPPPQMGLLGAITAHERERKREGGVGATLTEREREKRSAEERQRRLDEQQRQQLEQMQSLYSGQFPGYGMVPNPMMMMNPMMGLNPMMTGGLAPMMTGTPMAPMMTGQMGYPGVMAGYNPQHMYAAQQAAQAYQQAMMAFSVAGSQVGGEGGTPPVNPAMAGAGGMAGFDPRMSMMGMPMMTPLQMQMTGMSTFDARFPPNMNATTEQQPMGHGQAQFSSHSSSPVGRGSPLAQPADKAERGRSSSRPTSPKN